MQDAMATRKLDHVIMYVTIWKARDIVRIGEVFRSTEHAVQEGSRGGIVAT